MKEGVGASSSKDNHSQCSRMFDSITPAMKAEIHAFLWRGLSATNRTKNAKGMRAPGKVPVHLQNLAISAAKVRRCAAKRWIKADWRYGFGLAKICKIMENRIPTSPAIRSLSFSERSDIWGSVLVMRPDRKST